MLERKRLSRTLFVSYIALLPLNTTALAGSNSAERSNDKDTVVPSTSISLRLEIPLIKLVTRRLRFGKQSINVYPKHGTRSDASTDFVDFVTICELNHRERK